MSYSTNTSIYILLTGLTQNSSTTDVINQQITRIKGKIDSYVSSRYSVTGWTTVASTPQIIQDISDRLVAKRTMMSLWTRDGQNVNEWVNELAEEALEDLKRISKGEILVTIDGSEESTNLDVSSTRKDFTPVFDVDNVLNQQVDPDLIDEIDSERS